MAPLHKNLDQSPKTRTEKELLERTLRDLKKIETDFPNLIILKKEIKIVKRN